MAKSPDDEDRVSLAPLDAETALRALLAVKPAEDDDEPTTETNGAVDDSGGPG